MPLGGSVYVLPELPLITDCDAAYSPSLMLIGSGTPRRDRWLLVMRGRRRAGASR